MQALFGVLGAETAWVLAIHGCKDLAWALTQEWTLAWVTTVLQLLLET